MAFSVGRSLLTASRISTNSKAFLNSFCKDSHRFDLKNAKIFTRSLFSSPSVCAKAQSSDLHSEGKDSNKLDLSGFSEETKESIQEYMDNAIARETSRMKEELLKELIRKKTSTGEISQAHDLNELSEESVESPTAYKEELVGYLAKKIRAHPKGPVEVKLDGFEPEFNGTHVTLKKKIGEEIITIRSNVNDSLDDYDWYLIEPKYDASKMRDGMLKVKPDFTVEIQNGKKILSFWCTYVKEEEEEEGTAEEEEEGKAEEEDEEEDREVFRISKMSLYEGEYKNDTFTVTGQNMEDNYFRDLLMKYLEGKGITQEFAEKMVEFFTYHHYKEFLHFKKGIKSFVEQLSA